MRIKQQKGMTFFGAIIAFAVTGFALYSAVIMVLIHMDHLKIVGALDGLRTVHHVTQQSEETIRSKLRNNLRINNFYDAELDKYTKAFKIVTEDNELKVSIEYQVTYNLMFGYSLTRKYKDKVSVVAN